MADRKETGAGEAREEEDILLGDLEAVPAEAVEAVPTEVDVEESAPAMPPPKKKAIPPGGYKHRAEFPDLFSADMNPSPGVRGSPEEKVEYFRDKLKHAEARLAGFRDAWATRNAELDAVEGLLAEEHKRTESLNKNVQQLQTFIEQKKAEFETYGKGVRQQAFAEKEAQEKSLRTELDEAQAKATGDSSEAAQVRQDMEHDIAVRDEVMEKLKAAIVRLRETVEERDAEATALTEQLNEARAADEAKAAELTQLGETNTGTEARLAELQQQLADANANSETRVAELEQQLSDAGANSETRVAELEQQLSDASANSETRIAELEQQLADANANSETRVAELGQQLSDAGANSETRVAELEQQLADANANSETRIAELEQQLSDAGANSETRVAELEQQLSDASANSETRIAELEQQLSDASANSETRIAELEQQLADASANAETRVAEIESQLADGADSDVRIAELEEKLKSLSDSARTKIAGLNEQLAAATSAAESQGGSDADWQQKVAARDAAIAKLKESVRSIKARHESLEGELTAAREQFAEAQASLAAQGDLGLHVGNVKKALQVAMTFMEQVKANDPALQQPTRAADFFQRLQKALGIAQAEIDAIE